MHPHDHPARTTAPPRTCLRATPRRRVRPALLAVALALAGPMPAGHALAQGVAAGSVEGHVVAVQGHDVIVDIAAGHGAGTGDVVELWRPLVLRHPVTKKEVRDRFRIGVLVLRQVRERLSLAAAEGEIDRPPEPGDVVILPRPVAAAPAPTPAPAGGAPTCPEPAPPAAIPEPASEEASEIGRLFESLRGAAIGMRIAVYEDWVRTRPQSPYAPTLMEEAAMLRRLAAGGPAPGGRSRAVLTSFDPPEAALASRPLAIAGRLAAPSTGAVLHARAEGEQLYASYPMQPVGPGYYRATLPAGQMRPGGVEYFIEATDKEGGAAPVRGDGQSPEKIAVIEEPAPEPMRPPLATVAIWTDYADYNRWRGNDVAWQTEGYFAMRFGDTGMRAVRSGFGVYRGVGGSIADLDDLQQPKSARKVGLTYGYVEGEVGLVPAFGLVGRALVGLRDVGVAGGGQAMLRIGGDLGTNLLLGGELLGGVGMRGIAQLELNAIERWPMLFRAEVTNQPAGTGASERDVRPEIEDALPEGTSMDTNEVGGRGIAQVGFRIVDGLVVAVRGSYQGRNINHSGPGLGGAVSYSW
ncbi:MAG: hypothetical protein HY744_18120 [Deltaproteobacteria bacterium]|nr:hypothetical protein [Deltaproteobacteria bacterium]